MANSKTGITSSKVSTSAVSRSYKHVVTLNEREHLAIQKYCARYRVKNKTQFFRKTIINSILKQFNVDYPSLFEKQTTKKKTTEAVQLVIDFPMS